MKIFVLWTETSGFLTWQRMVCVWVWICGWVVECEVLMLCIDWVENNQENYTTGELKILSLSWRTALWKTTFTYNFWTKIHASTCERLVTQTLVEQTAVCEPKQISTKWPGSSRTHWFIYNHHTELLNYLLLNRKCRYLSKLLNIIDGMIYCMEIILAWI